MLRTLSAFEKNHEFSDGCLGGIDFLSEPERLQSRLGTKIQIAIWIFHRNEPLDRSLTPAR